MAWSGTGGWPISLKHIYGTKGRWVNEPAVYCEYKILSMFYIFFYQTMEYRIILDNDIMGLQGPLLLTWTNFNSGMDK